MKNSLGAAGAGFLPFLLIAATAWADDTVRLPDPVKGEHVESLVVYGRFEEALEFLADTGPLDFVWPAHNEIRDIDDQGRMYGEWTPERRIADSRDLKARCLFGLGRDDQAFHVFWRLLEDDPRSCSTPLLHMMASSAARRSDFDSIVQRLDRLATGEFDVADRALALVRVGRDIHTKEFDQVTRLLQTSSLTEHESRPYLKPGDGKWICREIVAQPDGWAPHLIEIIDARVRAALNSRGQPLLVVHSLGMLGDARAIAPLTAYREVDANYYVRQAIDDAIALISTHPRSASFQDARTRQCVRDFRDDLGNLRVHLYNRQPPDPDAQEADQRRRYWLFERRFATADQALAIVDALARAGFFRNAMESPDQPEDPGWVLAVMHSTGKYYWRHYGEMRSPEQMPEQMPQIRALRKALDDKDVATLEAFFQSFKTDR